MATPITALQYNTVQSKIAKILGQGTGDYGYGQPVLSNPILEGDVFTFEMFDSLRTDILSARQHQIGRMVTPPIAEAPAGGLITAAQFIQYTSTSGIAESNRLVTPPSSQAVREVITSTTLIDPWNNTTTHTIELMFTSGAAMRTYFNTGSTIEFSASRSGGSTTTKNSSWTSLLSAVGVVSFKRAATTSSKSAGTANGYTALMAQPTTPVKIFQRNVTDSFKPNYYSITAQLSESINNEPPAGIIFTIEFADSSEVGLDVNVAGTLTSTVSAYRAMGIFIKPDSTSVPFEAPSPEKTIDELVAGAALPTYSIVRLNATQMREGDNQPATFYVSTSNVDDGTTLYWTASGYGITANDFEDTDSIIDVPITIESNESTPIIFYAYADETTEKLERFNLQIKTEPGLNGKVVANIASSLQQIVDDSKNPPSSIALSTYRFISQTITSVNEGFNATFTIAATGLTKPVEVTWKAVSILGLVEGSDFASGRITGTFNITSTYTLNLLTIKDSFFEPSDAFQIEIYVMENNVLTLKDTSATMTIVDSIVQVPDGDWLVSSSRVASIAEGSPLGVQFTVTTPKSIKNNTKLYWKAVLTSANGVLIDSDFKNTGGIGIGGTMSSYIFVNNNTATLTRYASNDSFTEGTEGFAIEFYMDTQPPTGTPFTADRYVVASASVDITETTGYTITSPLTITEGNTTGLTYTVTTPYMEKGTLWWFIPTTPTITADDFNAMYGQIDIINSTGTFIIYAKDDGVIEGNESFQVVVRATSVPTDPILISSLSTTLNETPVYTIDTQGVASISEGGTRIDFAITTPKPAPNYVYWSLVSGAGSAVDKDDFAEGKISGQVQITNGAGSFYLTALVDGKTEGIESFHVVLRTGSTSGTIVKSSDPITITELVRYTINAVTTTLTEGASSTIFNITTPKVADNTILRWDTIAVSGVIQPTDFTVTDYAQQATQATSGTVRVANNRASFIMNARSDGTTEGAESFQIALYDADGNDLNTRSQTITLNEVVGFSILTPVVNGLSVTTFNEGTKVTLQVYTPKRDKGTPLYWKAVRYSGTITLDAAAGAIPPNDFDGAWNGTVYIDDANHAEIVIGLSSDLYSDGVDVFRVELRELSTSVLPVAVTLPLTISDTSLTPEVIIPDPPKVLTITPTVANAASTSIYEGGTIRFVVATENILPASNIYYSIYGGAGLSAADIFGGLESAVPVHVNANGIVNIDITVNSDVLVESQELFMLQIILDDPANSPIAISKAVSIIDALQYKVTASKASVLEGESIQLNFYTPPAGFGTTIRWHIDSVTVAGSSPVTVDDFDVTAASGALYGDVVIDGTGFGSVILTAASTDATEGPEYFTVSLSSTSNAPITLGTPSPQIKIRENIDYSLAVVSTPMDEGSNLRTFTFTTPKMTDSTFTYEVIQVSGTITYSDFEQTKNLTSGPIGNAFSTINNVGSFYLQARSDNNVEGNKDSFTVAIYKNGVPVAIKPNCPTIFIHETGAYNIELDTTPTLVPGGVVKYHITTPYFDDNTKIYWQILPYQGSTIAVSDFVETTSSNSLTGFVTLYSNEGWFTLQAVSTFSKGNTPFVIQLRTVSATGEIQPLGSPCPVVTITPAQIYSISSNSTVFTEGQSVNFSITTPALPAGSTVYWKLVAESGSPALSPSDFQYSMNGPSWESFDSTLSDYFTVGATTTPLILSILFVKDSSAESAKSFHLEVSLTSGGPLVQLSGNNPVIIFTDEDGYVVKCDKQAIKQNEAATYTVTVPASATTVTSLYWTVNTNSTVLPSYFSPTSGTVIVPSHPNATVDVQIRVSASLELPDSANNVGFTLSLYANTSSGAQIATPTMPVVSLSKGFILSGTTMLTAGGGGFSATVQTPVGTQSITWTIAGQAISDTELSTGSKTGNVDPDPNTGLATLPLISIAPRPATVAAAATTKSFILAITSNGLAQTQSGNIVVTYPAVIVSSGGGSGGGGVVVVDPPKTVVFDNPVYAGGAYQLAENKTVTIGVTTTSFKPTETTLTLELWSVATSTTVNPKATLRTNFTQTITLPLATDPVLLIGRFNVTIANNKGTVTLTSVANFNRLGASKFVIKTGSSIPALAESASIVIQPTSGISTPAADEVTPPVVDNTIKVTAITITGSSTQMTQGKGGSVQFTVTPAVVADITWAVSNPTGNVLQYITSGDNEASVTTGTITTDETGKGSLDLAIIDSEEVKVAGAFGIKFTAASGITKICNSIEVVAPVIKDVEGVINNTITFTTAGEYKVPPGTQTINFTLKGGGGMGGGGGFAFTGGTGQAGDLISGVLNVPNYSGSVLQVKIIPGGIGYSIVKGSKGTTPVAVQGILGRGGNGGDAMAIYWKGKPTLGKETAIAIVAGGGGGGAGGAINTTITASSTTSIVTKPKVTAGAVAKKGGAGGGGAPAGATTTLAPSVSSTRSGGGGLSYIDPQYILGTKITRQAGLGGAGGAGGASMNNTAPNNASGAAGVGPSLVLTPLKETGIVAPAIGDMWPAQGGYYAGTITDGGVEYYLIVSGKLATTDKENGGYLMKATNQSTTSSTSYTNGPQIFKEMLAENASTPGKWPAAAKVNIAWNVNKWQGFDDWYMPALNELRLVWFTFTPTAGKHIPRNAGYNAGDGYTHIATNSTSPDYTKFPMTATFPAVTIQPSMRYDARVKNDAIDHISGYGWWMSCTILPNLTYKLSTLLDAVDGRIIIYSGTTHPRIVRAVRRVKKDA